jgi:tetratricopeptide (TPR) repeat protein
MPFGRKTDAAGRMIDFDDVYRSAIAPGVADAGLLCVRADEEQGAGFIHKLMYERLLLSEFAVADLTILNANVYYELGIRHAARPQSTVLVMAADSRLPFDVQGLRALPYAVAPDGALANPQEVRAALAARLDAAKARRDVDSPLYQLVEGLAAPPIEHERTDVFRERAAYSATVKGDLAAARKLRPAAAAAAAVDAVAAKLGALDTIEAGVAIDLLLSYRAASAWERMIDLVSRMDRTLVRTVLVREQHAFALNRAGRRDEAEAALLDLVRERGPSSETNGLLGRVYKDRWEDARKAGDAFGARGWLKKAIEAYVAGFEADWRDAYPGVNAVTLMEIAEPPDPRRAELVPIVRYAVKRRLARSGGPDYWDLATLLELAVLAEDADAAAEALGDALAALREPWEAQTTARNLALIAEARDRRKQATPWLRDVIAALEARAAS